MSCGHLASSPLGTPALPAKAYDPFFAYDVSGNLIRIGARLNLKKEIPVFGGRRA